jgi:hypothetical protein
VKATTVLLELFKKEREWRRFFRSCCESRPLRLRSQAWQFRDELADRGHNTPIVYVEDALLSLARDLLPESAATQWDTE